MSQGEVPSSPPPQTGQLKDQEIRISEELETQGLVQMPIHPQLHRLPGPCWPSCCSSPTVMAPGKRPASWSLPPPSHRTRSLRDCLLTRRPSYNLPSVGNIGAKTHNGETIKAEGSVQSATLTVPVTSLLAGVWSPFGLKPVTRGCSPPPHGPEHGVGRGGCGALRLWHPREPWLAAAA